MAVNVTDLYIYPVKSCMGIRVEEIVCTPLGFENDRRWAIVEKEKGKALENADMTKHSEPWHVENQFEMHPELATICTAIEYNHSTGQNLLVLTHKSRPDPLKVEIRNSSDMDRKCIPVGVIHGNPSMQFAEDEGPQASAWLTSVLGRGGRTDQEFHLVWCPPDAHCMCSADPHHGKLFYENEEKAFTATTQYHIMNKASLESLNDHIHEKAPEHVDVVMNRFRPNIVVGGCAAWDEDNWKKVSVGEESGSRRPLDMRVCLPAFRCIETTIIQTGSKVGTRDPAAFKAMKEARVGPDGKPRFGIKLNQLQSQSRKEKEVPVVVRLNDPVNVSERTRHSLKGVAAGDDLVAELKDKVVVADEKIVDGAKSGDGTVINVGIRMSAKIQCPDCRQRFDTQKAKDTHWKFIHDPNRLQEE